MTTAGSDRDTVSRPPSTSRLTFTRPSATSTLDANVAWGRSHSAASICPVWLQLSSMAGLPRMMSPGCPCRRGPEDLGHRQPLQFLRALHEDRTGGADRHRGAQRLLALGDPAAHCGDLGHHAFFLQANSLLDGAPGREHTEECSSSRSHAAVACSHPPCTLQNFLRTGSSPEQWRVSLPPANHTYKLDRST